MSTMRPLALLAASLCFAACASAQNPVLAHTLAREGKADAAIAQARGILTGSPRNADAHELLCLLFRSVDHFDEAVHECEAARDLQPKNSAFVLELARTYGAKAEHAGTLTGMRMVGRIRDNFEHAAQLDPKNVDALSDLGEFYVEAPTLVGGGLDKARAIVGQLRPLSAERADRLAGMIAAKAGDTAAATSAFAEELAIARTPEAYVDLAVYARRRKDWAAAESNAVAALKRDTAHGADTVDAAQILLDIRRRPDLVETALRDYLAQGQPSTVMPAARVHTMLGRLLQSRGDGAGAHEQFEQALSLASGYEPARKALGQ